MEIKFNSKDITRVQDLQKLIMHVLAYEDEIKEMADEIFAKCERLFIAHNIMESCTIVGFDRIEVEYCFKKGREKEREVNAYYHHVVDDPDYETWVEIVVESIN